MPTNNKIKFQPPSSSTPGYLRRQKKALALSRVKAADYNADTIDELVDFLVDYVIEPKDRNEAKELLYDASEEQFNEMLDSVTGRVEKESEVPPTKSGA